MFFTQTPGWHRIGTDIVAALGSQFAETGLASDQLGLVLVATGATGAEGFAHRGDWRCYPCSLVKTFHLVHAIAALAANRVAPHPELDRAMADMIRWSSNTATNYVIDVLTGTTGDTLLEGADYMDWTIKRGRLNRMFQALDWPEFDGCNIVQKLMDDTRYGREAQFAGVGGVNLNALTPLATARLMWALFDGDLPLLPEAKRRAQQMLYRDAKSPDAANPHYQLSEYLGGNLPSGCRIWSKAGHNLWTGDPNASWFKHDMIRIAAPHRKPLTVVMMTQGQGLAETHPMAYPAIGRLIWDRVEGMLHD